MRQAVISYDIPSCKAREFSIHHVVVAFQIIIPLVLKLGVFALVLGYSVSEVRSFNNGLPTPIRLEKKMTLEEKQTRDIQLTFKILWGKEAPISFVEGVKLGSKSIRSAEVDPVYIAILLHTESNGKINARSPKNYRGLMQTPTSTGIPEADIMHGCKKLDEKLAWTAKNPTKDLRVATALYKGGLSKMAFDQADDVLKKYKRVKDQLRLA